MRIDLNNPTASQLANESNLKPVNAPDAAASNQVDGGDRTTLSSSGQSLSELVSQAMSSPAIRQGKVDALTQAIQSGKYELAPKKIAASMLDEHA